MLAVDALMLQLFLDELPIAVDAFCSSLSSGLPGLLYALFKRRIESDADSAT